MRTILHLLLHTLCVAAMFSLGLFSTPGLSFAQSAQPVTAQSTSPDPGPRGGTPAAGGPMPGLNNIESAYFSAAQARFVAIDSLAGSIRGQPSNGLGPRFNSNSCSSCHAQPAVGGTSPKKNPVFKVAKLNGATNTIPPFEDPNGPILEARFLNNPDGSADGHVHELFTIAGRSDAGGCSLAQPDFASQISAKNISFRVPTPLFGLGLIEAIPDLTLQNSFNASASRRASLGISGHFNISANDGTITRFGWKAQNKSLLMFSGEAYNVEMGVSNELFSNEINTDPACANPAGTPEDDTNLTVESGSSSPASDYASDIVNFAAFSRLSAPPTPATPTTTTMMGQQIFQAIGCDACHTIGFTTGVSATAALTNQSFAPYSDFAVHHMGSGLADGITQGTAVGDEFRTAPLMGIGQRLFLLHDGRTGDLNQAVLDHASNGSEANAVISKYQGLAPSSVEELLAFLRSL
jgi:CxxC motif-containing protein (DUF1111 family)